ncbi:hypothetical protein HNQ77_002572 [Silvibacterium bohemicum]|uniref:Carboxypeptidase regulatory-like domain-containing protein n=1 Tax=Silvibacterium bohemicum TaxID=1577686 RepID=A0A841JTG0_9BACT|nr:hypothetical protein [Silvibacterium bohemicum]MBB6144616.1 hypothetical protein [Silvibacterium bohemicum]
MLILPKRSLALYVAVVACALGAATFRCAAQDAAATYPVRGVVLNNVTHQPIARVLVYANADAVLTDNDGHFELNLPAGQVQINLRRPGYTARRRGMMNSVNVAANMPDLTFSLTPEAIITGHVTLSTGDEADGIRIMAYRKRAVNGRVAWTMQTMAMTNSEGAFRLASLEAPGSYLIYSMPAHARMGRIAPGSVGYGYASVFYPSVADFSAAGMIAVSPGQQAQADFTLTRQPFYPVSIAMPQRAEGRAGGAEVQIHDSSGRILEAGTRWDPQRGTAEINLPNGHYYAETHTFGESQMYGRVDFTVAGGPVSGLTMTLLPLHAIPVVIRKDSEGGNNQPQVIIAAGSQIDLSAGINLTLSPADAFENQTGSGLRHQQGSNDSSLFELENVSPGRYWVETYPFQGYVSSITCGGTDLTREPLVIGPGNTTAPIEITIRNDFGTLKGQLNQSSTAAASTSSGEISRIYIYAIPLFPTTSQVPQSTTQAGGQFTMTNLAPGSYHVIALDQSREIDANDTESLAQYTGKGPTVTVEANGTVNVQLDVIQTGGEVSTPE